MKQASDGFLLLIESLALVMIIVMHEVVISRWLPSVASALASAVIVSLALIPIYARRLSGKRILIFLLLMGGVIYVLAAFG